MKLRTFLERFLEWTVVSLMAALCLVVVLGVGFRKAGAALVWYDETASILLAWLTFYGAALAALKNAHLGFPNLVRGLPPALRVVLVVVREAIVVGFFVLVAWAGWRVLTVLQGMSMVSLPWMPSMVTHSVMPLGALLFVVAELSVIRQRLREAATTGEPTGS